MIKSNDKSVIKLASKDEKKKLNDEKKAIKLAHNNTETFYEDLYDIQRVNSFYKPQRAVANPICKFKNISYLVHNYKKYKDFAHRDPNSDGNLKNVAINPWKIKRRYHTSKQYYFRIGITLGVVLKENKSGSDFLSKSELISKTDLNIKYLQKHVWINQEGNSK